MKSACRSTSNELWDSLERNEPRMVIIGCDFHTRFQAKASYAALSSPARVGIEATGHAQWLERMLAEPRHELGVDNQP
jgi:hypothetical protein